MQELRQFIAKEYCFKCQGCCRFAEQAGAWAPRLLEEEKSRVAPLRRSLLLLANPQGDGFLCQFFDTRGNKCKIYAIRPFECGLYPFLLNRRQGRVYLSVDVKCPFIKEKGRIGEYNGYVQYLNGYFKDPDILYTLKRNPQVIQSYEDALDIFELRL